MKSFEDVLVFCIENKISLNQYLVLYANKNVENNLLFAEYKKVNGYEGKLFSDIMIEDLINKNFLYKENNKIKINKDKLKEI